MTGRILDITPAEYHADPCPVPSLSSGIARTLLRRSPMHAHAAHPRLGGQPSDPTRAMEEGTILHRLLLGAGEDYVPLPFDDFRKKEAQQAADAIRGEGKVPILEKHFARLALCAEKAGRQMRQHPDCTAFFAPGRSEVAVTWEERDGVWCRILVDRLPDDPLAPAFDLKAVAQSAAPEDYERTFIRDNAFQQAFYTRGLVAAGRQPPAVLFVVVEREPPHGVSVITAAPTLLAVAKAEVERAIALWGKCIGSGAWPGYSRETAHVSAPRWMLERAEELMTGEFA